jgi:hypothetical protein
VRRRLIVLATLGSLVGGLLSYRRRLMERRALEFRRRYG